MNYAVNKQRIAFLPLQECSYLENARAEEEIFVLFIADNYDFSLSDISDEAFLVVFETPLNYQLMQYLSSLWRDKR